MSDSNDLNFSLQGEEQHPDSLSGDFLKGIPDEDRPIVEKYVKNWDAGVTKRFQSIHDQYAPYKGLDPGEVEQAMNLMVLLENDPQFMLEQLAQYVQQQGGTVPMYGQQEEPQYVDEDGEPDPYGERFARMENLMTALAEQFLESKNQSQAEREDQELDGILSQLHEQYGDFNEQFVLAQMLQGVDPEEAVEAWESTLDSALQQRRTRPPAPIMGSGGGVPGNGVDPAKLSRKETQDYVAQMLAHAQQAAQ